MTNEAQVVDILREQINVEKTTLDKLVKFEEDAKETAVRLAFMELRLDTWKHIKFLEGMIELVSTSPCDEWLAKVARYSGRVKLEREIKTLISDEGDMVKLLQQVIKKIDDPLAALLLKHMKEEEDSHRDDLTKLVTLIKKAPLQGKKGQKGSDIICEAD